jgi:hypothetical protein
MKAALIPPIPELDIYGRGDFHLVLTHLLSDINYYKHYKAQRDNGAYLVLDNSAHEKGEGEAARDLLRDAMLLDAQEVVVPDVLFDAEKTVERAVQTHEEWFEAGNQKILELSPALMYVPQGQDVDEWESCLAQLIGIHLHSSKRYSIKQQFVIGVSKDYEMWNGGLVQLLVDSLLPRLVNVNDNYGFFPQVHLLGWGRDLWALRDISRMCRWVRSIDSAKPFVYAYHETRLHTTKPVPEYPGRPNHYFYCCLDEKAQVKAALHNVSTFRKLATA